MNSPCDKVTGKPRTNQTYLNSGMVARTFTMHRLSLFCWLIIFGLNCFNYPSRCWCGRFATHFGASQVLKGVRNVFSHSFSILVFQKLTLVPGMTLDYIKFIDSCSSLTPVKNRRVQSKYTLISQKTMWFKISLLLRVLFQSKISLTLFKWNET